MTVRTGMLTTRLKKQHETLHLYAKKAVKILMFSLLLMAIYYSVEKFKTYFPIKSVKVFGIKHTGQADLKEALVPLVNKGFFAIDVENIKDRLLKSPWVAKAIVQRVWPDKIFITLIEKEPFACWNNSNLLSTNGEIFNPELSSYPKGLPELIGPDGQQIQMLQFYKKLTSILAPLHFKIARFELAPEFVWNLTLENGIKMTAGYKDILTHMNHFVKVYPKIVGDRGSEIEYIDLRYTHGLAVRWKTVT